MPELPEVEVHRRNLQRWTRGRRVGGSALLDPRILEAPGPDALDGLLRGRSFEGIERRGKQLLLLLDGGVALASHLGMTGKWLRDREQGDPPRWVRFLLRLDDGSRLLFRDPRLFGRIRAGRADALRAELFDPLGPDPLEDRWSGAVLGSRIARSRQPVKVALMDQGRVAGLGNIQASEALWRAAIHPGRLPGDLTGAELDRLAAAILDSIRQTIEQEAGDEIRYVEEPGSANPFAVYQKAGSPCPRCGQVIARVEQAGRGTFFCPGCQPAP